MSVRSVFKDGRLQKSFSKILIASLLGAGVSLGRIDAADPATGNSIDATVQDVFKHAQSSVVKIEAIDENGSFGHLCGTGFFVDPNGTIYTSYSVGGESREIVVSYGEKKYPATRLIGDPRSGIAILKIEASTPFIPVSKSGDLAVATPVLAIGYPSDLSLTPSFGVVGGMDWNYLGKPLVVTHIRANVAVQPGEGGAPLLNLKGEAVGIVIASINYGTSCYAFPIEAAEKIRMDYVRFGEIRPGWAGIFVKFGNPATGSPDSAVRVGDLLEDTPAAKSGLKKGDILLQIGDKKINAPQDVLNASFFLTAGEEVPVTVMRGNQKVTVTIQPMLRPDVPAALPYHNFSGTPFKMQTQ
jgi:serine protease Do